MRTALILTLCAIGVAGGAYFIWTYGTEGKEEEKLIKRLQQVESEISRLRNEFKAFKEVTRGEYEQRLVELSEEVIRLREEVSALKKSKEAEEASGQRVEMRPPSPKTDSDKKDGIGERLRRFIERGKRIQEARIRRLRRRADELGWDATKTEQVVAILEEESEQMKRLIESYGGTSPEEVDREVLMAQIKQIRIGTMDSLKSILSEDEIRQIVEVLIPRRKPFKSRRRPPDRGEEAK